MADATPWSLIFLVSETTEGKFIILEARGTRLAPPNAGTWSVRIGCMIQTLPAEKVYLTRALAERRAAVLKEEQKHG